MSSFAGPWDPGSGQKSETARGRGIISVRNTASSQLSKAAFPSPLLSLPAPSADAQCSSTPASSPRSGPKRGWPVTHTSRRRRGQPSARRLPRGSGCGFRHRAISCFDLHSNVGRTVLRATCRSGANVSVEPAPFVSRPFCLTLRESCGRDPPPVFARTCPSPRIPSGVSRDACLRTHGRSRREPGCCRFPLRFCLVCRVHRHLRSARRKARARRLAPPRGPFFPHCPGFDLKSISFS